MAIYMQKCRIVESHKLFTDNQQNLRDQIFVFKLKQEPLAVDSIPPPPSKLTEESHILMSYRPTATGEQGQDHLKRKYTTNQAVICAAGSLPTDQSATSGALWNKHHKRLNYQASNRSSNGTRAGLGGGGSVLCLLLILCLSFLATRLIWLHTNSIFQVCFFSLWLGSELVRVTCKPSCLWTVHLSR